MLPEENVGILYRFRRNFSKTFEAYIIATEKGTRVRVRGTVTLILRQVICGLDAILPRESLCIYNTLSDECSCS